MNAKLEKIVQQAVQTFISLRRKNSCFDNHLKTLTALVNDLLFVDISMPARLFNRTDQVLRANDPIDFLPIQEDSDVVIGVFIIKKGAKIPLHDHPGMHGILKVLHGEVEIISYNISSINTDFKFAQPINVNKNETLRLTGKDDCVILTPTMNNIHEVKCINGPAAFLDILGPPYEDDDSIFPTKERACHYYQEKINNGEIQLQPIPCPQNYWFNQDI